MAERLPTSVDEFAGIFKKLGYRYPLDADTPPPGIEEYVYTENVVVPPGRDDDGNALPAGSKTAAQRLVAPPDGIIIVKSMCPIPKNRTAVESGYIQYRGVIESKGRSLFCAPGAGSDIRTGTSFGIGNVIILPKGILQILIWNEDPCSVGKWTLRWKTYVLQQC